MDPRYAIAFVLHLCYLRVVERSVSASDHRGDGFRTFGGVQVPRHRGKIPPEAPGLENLLHVFHARLLLVREGDELV